MSKTVQDYINITKENYKSMNARERATCIMHLEDYLDEKGYDYKEVRKIINQIKVEA